MYVSSLEIENFRNLKSARLECSSGLNLILGENASGKTSLLEALYFLGRARSFRTRQFRELIHSGQGMFRVVATMHDHAGADSVVIGIQRDARELIARIAGNAVRSLGELAARVPVLLLNPESHRLLQDGPQQRRRFMDWGLFYSNETFIDAWRRYGIALRNRNAALRHNSADRSVDAWDQEITCSAAVLDRLRRSFCTCLEDILAPLVDSMLTRTTTNVEYHRGWRQEQELTVLLHGSREQDRKYGYTRYGPHRADFVIKVNGWSVTERLSRGQQKLLVAALIMAQASYYHRHNGSPCILLIDDLPAELDRYHRVRIMDCLTRMDVQLFVTAIEAGLLDTTAWSRGSVRMFRIEDGRIRDAP
jgi:DNA replication and repair protein RecF